MENFHPLVVHFPVALLTSALLVETLALVLRKAGWRRVSLWNLGLGTAGAAAAVFSGRLAEAAAKHSMEIHEVMEWHERLGYAALGLAALALAWRLVSRDRSGSRAHWAAWILLAAACGILAVGAHLGGRLVYEFGVGGSTGRGSGIEVVR